MFKNLYQRLLTHSPLLWNTRVVWVMGVSLIIHLLFFLGGIAEVSVGTLKNYYSLSSVLSGGVFTFSILCSLAIIIIWLVFYLRNNAFKSFYIIDKYHSLKEFCIIIVILFFSIIFFESYKWGAWLKTRTITGKEQLVKEANIVNLASAFIPRSKGDYFKLIDCDNVPGRQVTYQEAIDYFDTARSDYFDSNNIIIRKVLKEKDAFSYKNYCKEFINLDNYKGFVPPLQWRDKRNRWIDNRNKDSIRLVLEECVAICKKYTIPQLIIPEELASLVFADSLHNVTRFFGRPFNDYSSQQFDYFDDYDLNRALNFIDNCYPESKYDEDTIIFFTVEMYIAICLSILLFCYRLYSKRVFLISIVGTIVWAILFTLFGISSSGVAGVSWFYIFLFALFILIAIISLNSNGNKTSTGVLLNWHIFMAPFVIMLIVLLINTNYHDHIYNSFPYRNPSDAELKNKYPAGYWVNNHTELLFRLNLLFVFLYIAFFFTRLSKKWHIMPEE
jgi:hypothetical protein